MYFHLFFYVLAKLLTEQNINSWTGAPESFKWSSVERRGPVFFFYPAF